MRIPDCVGTRMVIARSAPFLRVRASFNSQPAPVLAGVNVVRPAGRSTLTPAPGRRAQTLPALVALEWQNLSVLDTADPMVTERRRCPTAADAGSASVPRQNGQRRKYIVKQVWNATSLMAEQHRKQHRQAHYRHGGDEAPRTHHATLLQPGNRLPRTLPACEPKRRHRLSRMRIVDARSRSLERRQPTCQSIGAAAGPFPRTPGPRR